MLCLEGLIDCFSSLGLEVLNIEPHSNEIRDNPKPELYGLKLMNDMYHVQFLNSIFYLQ